ncbi:hypothetical protein C1C98_13290 [Pseudomonas ogarae]|uniref:Uncharacterized protein n=1 Tax=Pseudomonas ogarae (strain DSM 112162 / CECT 30235 / F113) TaxID=1114970 RepID=A0ABM6QYL5_PSEO1|nr:hypothetical protein C1C98_13290 [Pseudomonas ogarae]
MPGSSIGPGRQGAGISEMVEEEGARSAQPDIGDARPALEKVGLYPSGEAVGAGLPVVSPHSIVARIAPSVTQKTRV